MGSCRSSLRYAVYQHYKGDKYAVLGHTVRATYKISGVDVIYKKNLANNMQFNRDAIEFYGHTEDGKLRFSPTSEVVKSNFEFNDSDKCFFQSQSKIDLRFCHYV